MEGSEQSYSMFGVERPVRSQVEDLLGFQVQANWIAKDLLDRFDRDPSCGSCVAISGEYGAGKTSLLCLTEHSVRELRPGLQKPAVRGAKPGVVVVRFNPWWLIHEKGDSQGLFYRFASAIVRELESECPGRKKDLRKWIRALATIGAPVATTIASVAASPAVRVAVKGIKDLLVMLSDPNTPTLEGLIEQLPILVMTDGIYKPIVVVLDDLDRLFPDELLEILKLVRMFQELSGIHFVLAMDDEKVAQIITESLHVDGEQFLAKIVQQVVPVHVAQDRLNDQLRRCLGWLKEQQRRHTKDQRLVRPDLVPKQYEEALVRLATEATGTMRNVRRLERRLEHLPQDSFVETIPAELLAIQSIGVSFPRLYDALNDDLSRAVLDEPSVRRSRLGEVLPQLHAKFAGSEPDQQDVTSEMRREVKSGGMNYLDRLMDILAFRLGTFRDVDHIEEFALRRLEAPSDELRGFSHCLERARVGPHFGRAIDRPGLLVSQLAELTKRFDEGDVERARRELSRMSPHALAELMGGVASFRHRHPWGGLTLDWEPCSAAGDGLTRAEPLAAVMAGYGSVLGAIIAAMDELDVWRWPDTARIGGDWLVAVCQGDTALLSDPDRCMDLPFACAIAAAATRPTQSIESQTRSCAQIFAEDTKAFDRTLALLTSQFAGLVKTINLVAPTDTFDPTVNSRLRIRTIAWLVSGLWYAAFVDGMSPASPEASQFIRGREQRAVNALNSLDLGELANLADHVNQALSVVSAPLNKSHFGQTRPPAQLEGHTFQATHPVVLGVFRDRLQTATDDSRTLNDGQLKAASAFLALMGSAPSPSDG